jgi:RIO kinase 1
MTRDEQVLLLSMLDSFLDSGLISEVMELVRGGKEATVFRCRAGERRGGGYLAAKVYRPRRYRRFRDDADYQSGRVILDARARRAAKKRTAFGHEVHQGLWVAAEFETQQMLFDAGVDVPRPVECGGDVIVMEWIGDDTGPAPQLKDVKLSAPDAAAMFRRLLGNVETLLAHNRIHGDLSPFNVLVRHGRPILIDFPQAVDPRMNRNAYMLLHRDIDNLCRHFATRYGVAEANATRIAGQLWSRFIDGRV